MKSYILDIIPRIQRFSKKLDESSNLIGHHWVLFNDRLDETKTVFIFRSQNELIIAKNGIIEKSRWEYLGNDSIIIETKENSLLLKHGFLDEKILALKRDSFNDYSIFINESKANQEFNTIEDVAEFLNRNYLRSKIKNNTHQEDEDSIWDIKLSDVDKLKVQRLLRILDKGQLITKHKVNGEIEIKSYNQYKEWIQYYGDDMLIIIARNE